LLLAALIGHDLVPSGNIRKYIAPQTIDAIHVTSSYSCSKYNMFSCYASFSRTYIFGALILLKIVFPFEAACHLHCDRGTPKVLLVWAQNQYQHIGN
jgi:hypothetical protein